MPDCDFWRGRRVLITGHTGFKGGWLGSWLSDLGCQVFGVGLPPATHPSFFELTRLDDRIESRLEDLRRPEAADGALKWSDPEVIFHLAAQSVVRRALREPIDTFETNVMGTVRLLDAVRKAPGVRGVVVITSDKCYESDGAPPVFREGDPLGGRDPYSASKGCQEIVTHAYRRSFLPGRVATARAGNVIGGGDWAEDRIIPDAVRAIGEHRDLRLRNPGSVRPWQHVLDALAGYLLVAERICHGTDGRTAWNFGPDDSDAATVANLIDRFHGVWGRGSWALEADRDAGKEAPALRLDASLAKEHLGWQPRIPLDAAVRLTVDWYRGVLENGSDAFELTRRQVQSYGSLETA
jgi:CDP-glucose 4,6-dehydratase